MTRMTTTENGPLIVEGEIAISDFDGSAVDLAPGVVADGVLALCRCGHSKRKPFCDGSHATAAFDGALAADTPAS